MLITTFQPLAVIPTVVPTLMSVIGPIVMVALFTFLVAIPKTFLMLSYWLWAQHAPKSLRSRSIDGVKGNMFEGVALKQFNDRYVFSIPEQANWKDYVTGFFNERGAKLEDDGKMLTFSRGNKFCTYFLPHIIPWREKDFIQKITVRTTRSIKGQITVTVHYVVDTLCMLRIQPAGLHSEVGALYQELKAVA